jgi:hypothetical protein
MNTKAPVARYSEHLYQLAIEEEDPMMRAVWTRAADCQKACERPATDEQLAKIWLPWNALPAEMLPEEKRWILTGGITPDQRRQHAELRQRFPYLPLCKHEYDQALIRATRWSTLADFRRTTVELHQELVTRQWAFADADAHAFGRIAIYRAAQEIELTKPGLLKSTSPTLSDIQHLEARHAAYTIAREQALRALAKHLYKVPGICTGKPLSPEERAFGLPHPPNDVPRHLYIARLDALGVCSQARFQKFIHEDFLKLDRDKRQRFYGMSLKARHGKERYAALLVWLLDNRPIFEHEQFGWQWNDVQEAAVEMTIDCPCKSLKQWASSNNLALHLKRGPATIDGSRIARSKQLLSPVPVFGDVLKSGSA